MFLEIDRDQRLVAGHGSRAVPTFGFNTIQSYGFWQGKDEKGSVALRFQGEDRRPKTVQCSTVFRNAPVSMRFPVRYCDSVQC